MINALLFLLILSDLFNREGERENERGMLIITAFIGEIIKLCSLAQIRPVGNRLIVFCFLVIYFLRGDMKTERFLLLLSFSPSANWNLGSNLD